MLARSTPNFKLKVDMKREATSGLYTIFSSAVELKVAKWVGQAGGQETVKLPGGVAQLLRQLDSAWVRSLIVREAKRREPRPDRAYIPGLPEVDVEPQAGEPPPAGLGLSGEMKDALEKRDERRQEGDDTEEGEAYDWAECRREWCLSLWLTFD